MLQLLQSIGTLHPQYLAAGRALMQLTAGSVSKPQATAALANLVAYTEYFPKMTYPTEMVEVSCGGLEKFVSGGSVLQGLS